MSELNIDFNTSDKSKVLSSFSPPSIESAKKLLMLSRVTISFQKGDLDKFLILSGIIKETTTHQSKVVYKKRLEDTPEGPLSSNCDCQDWTENGHCKHTAALFIYYLASQNSPLLNDFNQNMAPITPMVNHYNFGVSVDEYGTIVAGPHKLIGAPTNPTYSSMQYVLCNRKAINFPIPKKLNGKIVILYEFEKFFNELTQQDDILPKFSFAFKNQENNLIKEISIFENLYLFNWKTGESFHLPKEIKSIVHKLRIYKQSLSLDYFTRTLTDKKVSNFFEIYIDGVNLDKIPEKNANCFFNISNTDKKGSYELSIQFSTENDIKCDIPEVLSAFTFEGGHLSSFKKKKDAYSFISSVIDYFVNGIDSYKVKSISSTLRDYWIDLVQHISDSEFCIHYNNHQKVVYKYDIFFIKEVLRGFNEYMDDQFFRFSKYSSREQEVSFICSSSNLFKGISQLNNILTSYNVPIYYNNEEISRWNGRMKFDRLNSDLNWFNLELSMSDLDLEIIRNADLEAGISITNDGILILNDEQKNLARFMKRYLDEKSIEKNENNKFIIPFSRMRIFELFELKKLGIDGALNQEEEELCQKLENMKEMPTYEVPESLTGVLRPYQKVGYNWLRFLYEHRLGACLADDMGLGKTLQTITFIQSIYNKIDKVLIVCPVTILINWENEIKKFSDLSVSIYHGGSRKNKSDSKIILTSYGVMKKEADTTFKNINFDILILDEVQHLKNIRSLGAFAARKINANFRIGLTGTPVENDLAEFYNIIDLCIPGVWGDLQFIKSSSTKKSRSVARKTAAPFILRRTKSQVLTDLPPKIENDVLLEFTEDERKNYLDGLIKIRNSIFSSTNKRKYGEVLRGLLKLRQNCLWQNPNDSLDNKIVNFSQNNFSSTKIKFLIEQLEQILEEGHQAIIFSQFTTYLDMIQHFIRERHWQLSRIDGSQTTTRRQREVDDFQSGKTSIFLISLKAGGVGLNLTAASYVFVMDPWWNPAVERQAIDRAHRIGQKNTLTIYRPIIKDSVEEKVLKLQQIKKDLFTDLLPEDDEHQFSGKLTMDDFESLLR